MSSRRRIVGVVLTAGASTRAAGVKALAVLDGEPLVRRALTLLRAGGADDVMVVVGAPHGEAVAKLVPDARMLDNPDPRRGMMSSLRVALEANATLDGALFVALVDHPHVRADTARALCAEWRRTNAPLVRPRHGQHRGHPYLIDSSLFERLLGLREDESPRPLFDSLSDAVELDVDDAAVLEDLDTTSELDAAGVRRQLT